MIEFDIFDYTHLLGTNSVPQTHCANMKKHLDLQKFTIFREISCPALPEKSELLRLGEIRLATGTRGSIEVLSKGQNQWCVHLRPFLALRTIPK